MAYVSARYTPKATEAEPDQVFATDENDVVYVLYADSDHPDWVAYLDNGGTIDPAPPPPLMPPPEIIVPERDYGAEIDALDARVTALEEKS